MPNGSNIIHSFDEYYDDAYNAWSDFYPLAERDLRFYLGDQWSQEEKSSLFQESRNAFVFNRIRRNINMVSGFQRKHRLSSVVAPVENSDQKTADQLSQLLLYAMNYADGYNHISDAFSGALKTGWNLLSLWMDYSSDPINGDIRISREPYNSFIVDPYFTQLDWSDCNFVLRRKYLSPDMVAALLPKYRKDIYDMNKYGWERDDKFTWLPYQRNPSGEDLMAYNEMYEMKYREVPTLVDTETGEMIEFDRKNDQIRAFLQIYPQLKVIKRPKKTIYKHIIVNDEYIKTEQDQYGLNEYPFVPFVSFFEPETDQWDLKVQSLVRCQIDPQRESNRRRSQMIDLLDSQINSGWIAKENSVINPQSLFQSSQGRVIWTREDSQPQDLQKIPAAQIPPSMFQLQELFDRDVMEIAGMNDAAFGQTENAGESGVMMMLRQGASIVNLQDLFDRLRLAQKTLSKKMLTLIQTWSPQKVQRIINEQPTQEFYNNEFTKYDITVQEGILTDTQRQMYFRQLVDLKQLGAPVTGEMLAKAAPIQGKSEYIEELAQMEQQQAKAQQQQQQVQEQLLDSQRQMAQAKAISDIALSKERFTRSVANMGLQDERASEAIQNRAQANLDRAKAIKELESMDDDRLLKYLQIVKLLEEQNKAEEQQTKADDVMVAEASEQMNAAFPQTQDIPPEAALAAQQQQLQMEQPL